MLPAQPSAHDREGLLGGVPFDDPRAQVFKPPEEHGVEGLVIVRDGVALDAGEQAAGERHAVAGFQSEAFGEDLPRAGRVVVWRVVSKHARDYTRRVEARVGAQVLRGATPAFRARAAFRAKDGGS